MIIPLEAGAIPIGALCELLATEVPAALYGYIPRRLVTSSDEVKEGDLFCALRGKRDGHAYIGDAIARGAVAVLSEERRDAAHPIVVVPSVRAALGKWAAAVAKGNAPLRIGITGSVGKTTTKDAIAAMLSVHYRVHATYGNRNNDLGLPFTLLSAPKDTEVLVCEVGINHPNEMETLSAVLRPHISVITCIGHAHIGAFGTRERIAAEKRLLLSHALREGRVLVPYGEPLLAFLPPHGILRTAVDPSDEERFRLLGISLPAEDAPRRFATAYADEIAKALGLSVQERREGAKRIAALTTRRKEERVGELLFIDDGYNASPESMLAALTYLKARVEGYRVAVLGDMLELGENSEGYHRAVGRYAAGCADLLCFFGAYAKEYAKGARAGGATVLDDGEDASARYVCLAGDREEMASRIAALVGKSSAILFKASRAHEIEKTIALVKEKITNGR